MRVEDDEAIAAGVLRRVHRGVREREHLALAQVVEQRHAHGSGDPRLLVAQDGHVPVDQGDELRGHDVHRLAVRRRKQDGELVAAEPRQHVGRTATLPQARAERAEQLVADRMAEAVVDRLEAVEVEHQHRSALVEPAMALNLARELLLEAVAVEQAREQVVIDQVPQADFELAPLGDVLELVGERHRCSGAVARGRERHPDGALVGPLQAYGRLKAGDVSIQQAATLVGLQLPIGRDHELGDRALGQLVGRVAGHLRQRIVGDHDRAVRIDYGHAQRGVREGRPEKLAEPCDLEPGSPSATVTDHAAHSRPSTDPSGSFYTFSWSNANTITPSTGRFTRSLNQGSWRGQRRGSRRAAASRPLPGSRPRACRPARRRGRRARAGPSRGSRRRRRRRRRRRPPRRCR